MKPSYQSIWKPELASALRKPSHILQHSGNNVPENVDLLPAHHAFSVLSTQHFLSKVKPGNLQDPLLLQVMATPQEANVHELFVKDPVGDSPAKKEPGLLHKYNGRILVVATGSCAIHCRYCFRRNYAYGEDTRAGQLPARLAAYLRQHTDVEEVILSGGDPLLADNETLALLLEACNGMARIRIHTRLPTVLPTRFDKSLLGLLGEHCHDAHNNRRISLVCHVNHAQELDASSHKVFQDLQGLGIMLLNQSVLLRGVNDNAKTLAELSKALFRQGVLPYYLHQLDRVQGAAHFEVDVALGKEIIRELKRILPGYLVPKYVQEIAGEPFKISV